jgi:nucleoside-diphosphate kinase
METIVQPDTSDRGKTEQLERSLVMLKPDAFQRRMLGRLLTRFEDKGLTLVAAKLALLREDEIRHQYIHVMDKPYFSEIVQFLRSSPVLLTVWCGPDCVETVRRVCGVTNGRVAAPGTIRGDWSSSVMCNLVHASDSRESAQAEIALYFADSELLEIGSQQQFLYVSDHEFD